MWYHNMPPHGCVRRSSINSITQQSTSYELQGCNLVVTRQQHAHIRCPHACASQHWPRAPLERKEGAKLHSTTFTHTRITCTVTNCTAGCSYNGKGWSSLRIRVTGMLFGPGTEPPCWGHLTSKTALQVARQTNKPTSHDLKHRTYAGVAWTQTLAASRQTKGPIRSCSKDISSTCCCHQRITNRFSDIQGGASTATSFKICATLETRRNAIASIATACQDAPV